MHALMGKGGNSSIGKSPTPQELYRARRQKEEEEKNAFLPPGLVNHGNTCFMNSVLQGLIATPMLVDIIRFSLPEYYAPVSSRRSPQLTNGHGVGGEYEREVGPGMPLGDTFVQLMLKAWNLQDERVRQSMSPKDLLQTIGAKFDQYLDFRQQDAHEFLRHLLDAMRMEELDIIKKRQPAPPKAKRKRKSKSSRTKSAGGAPPNSQPQDPPELPDIPEEDRLTSFVDMVFGGRLASILVCSKCQKISCTYEDFNDLSLSIKQDDYYKASQSSLLKAKKKYRLKSLAKKLGAGMSVAGMGMRGRGVTRELEIPEERGPRSSSVPASPLRRSEEAEKSFELLLGDVDQRRRRSLDAGEETPSLSSTAIGERGSSPEEKTKEDKGENTTTLSVPEDEPRPSPSEDEDQKALLDSKRDKEKDEGWIKLRRKISVSMSGKKGQHHKKKREQEVPPIPGLAKESQPGSEDTQTDDATITSTTVEGDDEVIDSFVDVKAPSPSLVAASRSPAASPSPSASPLLNASATLQRLAFVRRPSSRAEKAEKNSRTNSPAISASTSITTFSRPRTPDIPNVSLPPTISPVTEEGPHAREMRLGLRSRPTSPSPGSRPPEEARPKSPQPSKPKTDSKSKSKPRPKPKRSESAYMRRLLADVPTSSFSSSSSSSSAASGWTKLGLGLGFGHGGTVQSVEGCLRMFTAVEVLEGENMVGCRRCWKIQHGEYVPREKRAALNGDEDEEGEDEDEDEDEGREKGEASDSSASVKISLADNEHEDRVQDQATADESLSSSLDLSQSEHFSVHSSPVPASGTQNSEDLVRYESARGVGYLNSGVSSSPALALSHPAHAAANVPVPSISMTAPESSAVASTTATTATTITTTPSASEQTPTVESPDKIAARRLGSSPSRDSLQLPAAPRRRPGHSRQPAERSSRLSIMTSDTSSLSSAGESSEDEDSGEEDGETEASPTASMRSEVSSIMSAPPLAELPENPQSTTTLVASSTDPSLSERREVNGRSDRADNQRQTGTVKRKITDTTDTHKPTSVDKNSVPRSKQVVLRRAYKRYLIASPPPVLVVHLKRFQQTGKPSSHSHAFSGRHNHGYHGYSHSQYQFFQANFKKLDDVVSFPEYLDLSPYLLPSREEVLGEGSKKSRKEKKRKDDEKVADDESEDSGRGKNDARAEGCMYRLYAVIVHIGNMLGGHYVAYTALPEPASMSLSAPSSSNSSSTVPTPSRNGAASSSPSSTSLPSSSTQTVVETQTLRPEVPRTASFTRTAVHHPQAQARSRSSHSLAYSNASSNSTSQSRPSSSSGGATARANDGTTDNKPTSTDAKEKGEKARKRPEKQEKQDKPQKPQRQWCYVSDTVVRLASLEEVLQAKAYICMYERVS